MELIYISTARRVISIGEFLIKTCFSYFVHNYVFHIRRPHFIDTCLEYSLDPSQANEGRRVILAH